MRRRRGALKKKGRLACPAGFVSFTIPPHLLNKCFPATADDGGCHFRFKAPAGGSPVRKMPRMTRPVLGLDIGGANLKAAHTSGAAKSVPFALWRDPGGLDAALGLLVAELPAYDALAVTMTGELCDCFASKREGVNHILDAVEGRSKTVRVWTNEGEFVDVPTARREALKVASANWLALATFAGRYAPEGPALLIDVGTTTTDILTLFDGVPAPTGRTDPERLASGELVYRGWKRTPLCALADASHAAELFATMQDVCLTLEMVPEDTADRDTSDGQPATREFAERRLARMRCADFETSMSHDRHRMAEEFLEIFSRDLGTRVSKVAWWSKEYGRVTLIVSGSGSFLCVKVIPKSDLEGDKPFERVIDLNLELGATISAAACAYAVAVLAQELEG
jgi:(4-(4-[2-(gamma-L-glutamylamino)ethyl]phenoxymethyl)furan-2-yl)methanamine synthase